MDNRPDKVEIKFFCWLNTSQDAEKLVMQVAYLVCAFSVYQVMFGVSQGLDRGWPLILDALFEAFTAGAMWFSMSRIAAFGYLLLAFIAVYGTLLNLIEQFQPGAHDIMAALLHVVAAVEGIRGTSAYYRLKKLEEK